MIAYLLSKEALGLELGRMIVSKFRNDIFVEEYSLQGFLIFGHYLKVYGQLFGLMTSLQFFGVLILEL